MRDCSLLLHVIHTEGDVQRILFQAKQYSPENLFATKFLDTLFVCVPNVSAVDLIRMCAMCYFQQFHQSAWPGLIPLPYAYSQAHKACQSSASVVSAYFPQTIKRDTDERIISF